MMYKRGSRIVALVRCIHAEHRTRNEGVHCREFRKFNCSPDITGATKGVGGSCSTHGEVWQEVECWEDQGTDERIMILKWVGSERSSQGESQLE
jgi:hypothetical protein